MRRFLLLCSCPLLLAAAEPGITLVPQNMYLNLNQGFDESGRPQHYNGSFNLSLSVRATAGLHAVGMGKVVITECRTDADEDLLDLPSTPENNDRERYLRLDDRTQRRGKSREIGDLNLQMKAPTKPAHALARLVGTIEILQSDGKRRFADLKPLSEWSDKRLRLPGATGNLLLRDGRNGFEVVVSSELTPWIDDLLFLDGSGTELPTQNQGTNKTPEGNVHRFMVELPKDASVSLRLHGKLTAIIMPFSLLDLALPGQSKAATGLEVDLPLIDGPDAELPEAIQPIIEVEGMVNPFDAAP